MIPTARLFMRPTTRTLFSSNIKKWFAPEAAPIVAVVTFVLVGGTVMIMRASRGPDVVWTKENHQPWQSIHPGQNVKLLNVHQKYDDGTWHRDKW